MLILKPSFHLGSQAADSSSFSRALTDQLPMWSEQRFEIVVFFSVLSGEEVSPDRGQSPTLHSPQLGQPVELWNDGSTIPVTLRAVGVVRITV